MLLARLRRLGYSVTTPDRDWLLVTPLAGSRDTLTISRGPQERRLLAQFHNILAYVVRARSASSPSVFMY